MEFQECSNYARQDAMVMCLHKDFVTHYIHNHVHNVLKPSVGNYHTIIQHCGLSICISDVMMPRDSHIVIPKFIGSIVVVLVPMCAEHWLL